MCDVRGGARRRGPGETAEFTRHQVLLDVAVSLEAQLASLRQRIASLVVDTVQRTSRAGVA